MVESVRYKAVGCVAVLILDRPPVNALGHGLRARLWAALHEAEADPAIAAIVVMGAGRVFTAGADIREFGTAKPGAAPTLPDLIRRIEACAKPVVAAIHGPTRGGGVEIALGCHFRLAHGDTTLALPEVKLGLLPGAGGTQRLPRLVGLHHAVEMIVGGEPVSARQALDMGLIDEIAERPLRDSAVAFAAGLDGVLVARRRTASLPIPEEERNPTEIFEEANATLDKKRRGEVAPRVCLESLRNCGPMTFEEGLAAERKLFLELQRSDQHRALKHAFFAERACFHVPGLSMAAEDGWLRRAAVIGAGTMGGAIAMNFANAGIPVRVVERDESRLEEGLVRVRKTYGVSVRRGTLAPGAVDRRMALIHGTTRIADIADADVVIEAVFEDMALKKRVFRQMDSAAKPGAVLATNTSSLNVAEIASSTGRPGDVLGLHFFSPANVMKLVEVVRAERTSSRALALGLDLPRRLGKVGVVVGVCDGFVGNRMFHQYTRQAQILLEEGALPHQIDAALEDFGFRMGPFRVGDLAGLDIGWAIRKRRAASRPAGERYPPLADRVCEMGRFGQKTAAGWYRYDEGGRAPRRDPEVEAMIVARSREAGIARRDIAGEEIVRTCVYRLINEGAKLLDEGLAMRASDIDAIWIHGYGFPRYRGGPMYLADTVGLPEIRDRLAAFARRYGDDWRPGDLICRLTESGASFADHDRGLGHA